MDDLATDRDHEVVNLEAFVRRNRIAIFQQLHHATHFGQLLVGNAAGKSLADVRHSARRRDPTKQLGGCFVLVPARNTNAHS